MKRPLVSIIIPTLNAAKVLPDCLQSIVSQKYHQKEIIICDGGSTDSTLKIASKYNCIVVRNPLITSESGKVVGVESSRGKYIALIDSDNILPSHQWLDQMISPLENDSSLVGSEPYEFTYRPHAGFIERYCALLGVNDPYSYVLGIYDRKNYITNKWTAFNLPSENLPDYFRVKLDLSVPIPTIGANGTVFHSEFLKKNISGDYLFDIDLLSKVIKDTQKPLYFAKVKNGIIHTYCESSIFKFYRKQLRRLKDYYYYRQLRSFDYKNNLNKNPVHDLYILVRNNFKFTLYTFLFVPMLITLIKGYSKKPDPAWLFHPLACYITFFVYFIVSISSLLGFNQSLSRKSWQQ